MTHDEPPRYPLLVTPLNGLEGPIKDVDMAESPQVRQTTLSDAQTVGGPIEISQQVSPNCKGHMLRVAHRSNH